MHYERRCQAVLVLALVVTVSQAITASGPYRKQHQQALYIGSPMNNGRWQQQHHQHQHRGAIVPATRVHRSGSPNYYHQAGMGGTRFRGPPIGPVKRVYLPYKHLSPQMQHKFRYSVGGPVQAKRQTMNAPPPGWKPKRSQHLSPSLHPHNNYIPVRKNKHPSKYIPNVGKLSQNYVSSSSVVTDSYGAPYKLTSTTYGVPHPTQGAPEPPISNSVTSTKETPSSYVQVYHGNNREVETKNAYAFNTQHQVSTVGSGHRTQQQSLSSQQHQTITRPSKAKTSQGSVSPSVTYHLESSINEQPVYRPTTNNSTYSKSHHKISVKETQSSSNYGGFQPPKQTYGFQPYEEKETSLSGISTSDPYYSSSSSQTASTASLAPSSSSSSSSATTSTHLSREEYLSPNYFQQKSS